MLKLLGYTKTAYIVTEGNIMNGVKINNCQAKEMLEQINLGESDSAVIALMIGGAGLNCQGMNAVIHMAPCFQAAMERQANGTS